MDWIDDLLNDECSLYQLTKIESLMQTSSVSYLYENVDFESLTEVEAEKIIQDLYENNNPIDPREQFKKMFRDGN